MKRIVSALIALVMLALSLFGCGNGGKKNDDKNKNEGPKGPVFRLEEDEIKTFSNFFELEEDFGSGIGDPFVMRYDGMYYMYPSSGDNSKFLKCWTSKDLVNWEYGGIVGYDSAYLGAYAPEVTYFNGKFYMYSATPEGDTHRCLVSDSPLGIFKIGDKGAQGRAIDGHVFIDNDGKWYFYSASGTGIQVYEMQEPTWIGNPSKGSLAQINGAWTEGPMVVYHDGIYYLTYTGNHVLNKAYRIPYSISTSVPYSGYRAPKDNILLISTEGELYGTGHSSSVKAPDLDSYYIVYHTLHNGRVMNIDRIVFEGETMDVMGPTTEKQPFPSMPDIYAHFDEQSELSAFELLKGSAKISGGRLRLASGSTVLSKDSLGGNKFTLEVTTAKLDKNATAGAIFGYKDSKNYGSAAFDVDKEKLIITFVVNGKKTTYEKALVRSFNMPYDFDAVQAIQVEKTGKTFTFYVNDRELCKYESDLSGSGKIGMFSEGGEARIGYIGASDETGGSSTAEFYKPVGKQAGTIFARLCLEDDEVKIYKERDKTTYVEAKYDQSLNYRIYAASDGSYTLGMEYRSEKGAEVEIYLDGKLAKTMKLKADKGFTTEALSGLKCTEGKHVITFYVKSGELDFKSFTMLKTAEETVFELDFNKNITTGLHHSDGFAWKNEDGALVGNQIGKRTYGDSSWADYTFEADVTFTGKAVSGGLLVRTSNIADSSLLKNVNDLNSAQMSEQTVSNGRTWFQGYYIKCGAKTISVYRYNYAAGNPYTVDCSLNLNETYRFRIECDGAHIRIYVNDKLCADYVDDTPFLTGAVGVKTENHLIKLDNVKVTVKND